MQLKKNRFNWNFDTLTSSKIGSIIPSFYEEVEPGTTVNLNPNIYLKLAPLALPTQGRFQFRLRHVFVPYRLIDTNFEKRYIDRGTAGAPPYHYLSWSDFTNPQKLYRYFPWYANEDFFTNQITNQKYPTSMYPIRAYRKAFQDHCNISDQLNLNTDTLNFVTTDGEDNTTSDGIEKSFYPRDNNKITNLQLYQTQSTGTLPTNATLQQLRNFLSTEVLREHMTTLTRNAIDSIAALFGVPAPLNTRSTLISDIQRNLDLSEVMSTSSTTELPLSATVAVGMLTSQAKSQENIVFTVPEFGCIIGLMELVPYIYDINGIRKPYLNTDDADTYYKPELASIGLKAVNYIEVVADESNKNTVVGYEPPYQHKRVPSNYIAGDYKNDNKDFVIHRNSFSTSLLNLRRVQYDEYDYLFADATEPHVRFQIRYQGFMERPIPRILSTDSLQITESVMTDNSSPFNV